jgi:hypothetical protein
MNTEAGSIACYGTTTLKGIVSRDEYFLKAYDNKYCMGTFCTCTDRFTIFCFLVDEKIQLKFLACSFESTY